MVLVLQLEDVYRASILGFASQKELEGRSTNRTYVTTYRVNVIFCEAGFRPGRRGPFVLAKGPKTNDAPPASADWTDATTRRASQLAALRQGPPIDTSVRPEGRVAGVRPWETNIAVPHRKEPGNVIYSDWQGCMGKPLFPILRMTRKNPSGVLVCGLSAGLLLSGVSTYWTVRDRYPVREIQENGVEKK